MGDARQRIFLFKQRMLGMSLKLLSMECGNDQVFIGLTHCVIQLGELGGIRCRRLLSRRECSHHQLFIGFYQKLHLERAGGRGFGYRQFPLQEFQMLKRPVLMRGMRGLPESLLRTLGLIPVIVLTHKCGS